MENHTEKLERGKRIWTKLDRDFVESAKVISIKEQKIIVGYTNFNQTQKRFERNRKEIFTDKQKAKEYFT